jgi:hypothetical protein
MIINIFRTSRNSVIQNSNTQHIFYTSKPLSKAISEMNLSGKHSIEDETCVNGK